MINTVKAQKASLLESPSANAPTETPPAFMEPSKTHRPATQPKLGGTANGSRHSRILRSFPKDKKGFQRVASCA
ncbi:hypothetical protein M441DRAFT_255530 [Trichoderma asperellum CBS 433.97]|uniref:Uncharacterized protein n=1 Tax=Trichoderma asperellum (strain ATCC 204424 / CBS 433.97 / NBRC 101777) TaxID=1042311 RepID=A0A2T3YYT5_TRIA4|nr:hypothetical protein M441DRAFT_255530 [Trichoderma asperellum CBS 433.97]PTB37680.1 hypothetical protein M441DRAFT_255530 [Trichoderma asperellum CBS 433.97]